MKKNTYSQIVFFLLLILFCLGATSKVFSAQHSLYNFLRITGDARTTALSGSTVAFDNDLANIYFNPASLILQEDKDVSATFLKNVIDINSGNIVYNLGKSFEEGKLAVNINYTNYGDFEYADFNGKSGSFTGNDISLGVTYSNQIDSNFYYGVTPKLVYMNLEQNTSLAFALDAGLLYKLADGRTNIGLAVLHTGTQITKIGSISEGLPTDVRIGFNHRLKGLPLLFNFSFVRLADGEGVITNKLKNITLGAEISIGKYIEARIGFDNQIRSTTNENNRGMSGLSLGLGAKIYPLKFDYGFTQYGAAVSLHRITISSNINSLF